MLGLPTEQYCSGGHPAPVIQVFQYERCHCYVFWWPIAWKADRQDRTSLSLCEAKIRATNMGSRLTVNTRNMILSLYDLGYPITDCNFSTTLYNDNAPLVWACSTSLPHILACAFRPPSPASPMLGVISYPRLLLPHICRLL